MDAGHAFFNLVMKGAQSKLTKFISYIPVFLKSQDLEDEASTFALFHFQGDDESEDAKDEAASSEPEEKDQREPIAEKKTTIPKKRQGDNQLSEAEAELQRDFLVLGFLYDLNRIREVVREVWLLYRQGSLSLITAALVTDLAQSYIQQNVAGLTGDLDAYEVLPRLLPSVIVHRLFAKLSVDDVAPEGSPDSTGLSDIALRHLLCIDALLYIKAYLYPTDSMKSKDRPTTGPGLPFLLFLNHFDAVRKGEVTLPIRDKFTKSMLLKDTTPNAFLPFGLQIVLDVHEIMQDNYRKIFTDVTSYCYDTAKLIRSYVSYEDVMWEAGNKTDYMTANNVKFTNVYFSSLDALLNWVQELLKTDKVTKDSTEDFGMATDIFVTMHATLAGLSMWQFGKTYHGFSIAKVSWFVTFLGLDNTLA